MGEQSITYVADGDTSSIPDLETVAIMQFVFEADHSCYELLLEGAGVCENDTIDLEITYTNGEQTVHKKTFISFTDDSFTFLRETIVVGKDRKEFKFSEHAELKRLIPRNPNT